MSIRSTIFVALIIMLVLCTDSCSHPLSTSAVAFPGQPAFNNDSARFFVWAYYDSLKTKGGDTTFSFFDGDPVFTRKNRNIIHIFYTASSSWNEDYPDSIQESGPLGYERFLRYDMAINSRKEILYIHSWADSLQFSYQTILAPVVDTLPTEEAGNFLGDSIMQTARPCYLYFRPGYEFPSPPEWNRMMIADSLFTNNVEKMMLKGTGVLCRTGGAEFHTDYVQVIYKGRQLWAFRSQYMLVHDYTDLISEGDTIKNAPYTRRAVDVSLLVLPPAEKYFPEY